MPKPDLEFALRSIETSSLALAKQMAAENPSRPNQSSVGRTLSPRAKLLEALNNHQRTLGRLMRQRPLQQLMLTLAVSGEIGKLQQQAGAEDFKPDTARWKQAGQRWKELQAQALATLENMVSAPKPDAAALRKAFGLALLTGAVALFLDGQAPRLSARLADDRYKTALSELRIEDLV